MKATIKINEGGFSSITGLLIVIGVIAAGLGAFLLTRQTPLQPFDVNVPHAQKQPKSEASSNMMDDRISTNETQSRTTNGSQFKKPIDEDAIFCNKNICTIAIVVKKENYSSLASEISIWIGDVERETRQKVELKIYENNVTKEKIRSDLKDLYLSKNLQGAVLVGNIPYVRAGARGVVGKESFDDLSDYFYVDVKNECEYTSDNDGIYNNCFEDSTNQPFWISRLTPPLHDVAESNKLLKNYFIRNHNFRTGKTTFQQRYLAYAPILMEMQNPFRNNTVTGFLNTFKSKVSPYDKDGVKFIPPEGNDNDFLNELSQPYEYVYYNGHGSPFSMQQNIDYQKIVGASPKALFYQFGSCSVGRYSEEKYLAGTFLFNSDALAVLAAQVPIFVVTQPEYDFQMFLLADRTIGEASRKINIGALKVLGDGTLKLRYKKELPIKKPEIMLEKIELDLGKLSLKEVEKKVIFKVQNTGNSPLIINIRTIYPSPSRIKPNDGASVAWDNPSEDLVVAPNEIKEHPLNVSIGGYTLPQTRPYVGQYSGFFYVYTSDPTNYIVKIPFKGEITE
jgi:hypothetical protein